MVPTLQRLLAHKEKTYINDIRNGGGNKASHNGNHIFKNTENVMNTFSSVNQKFQ